MVGPGGQLHVLLRTPIMDRRRCQLDLNRACLTTYRAPPLAPPSNGTQGGNGAADSSIVAGPVLDTKAADGAGGAGVLEFDAIVAMPGGGQKFTVPACPFLAHAFCADLPDHGASPFACANILALFAMAGAFFWRDWPMNGPCL